MILGFNDNDHYYRFGDYKPKDIIKLNNFKGPVKLESVNKLFFLYCTSILLAPLITIKQSPFLIYLAFHF